MHGWLKTFERYWAHRIDKILQRAERKMMDQIARESQNTKDKEK